MWQAMRAWRPASCALRTTKSGNRRLSISRVRTDASKQRAPNVAELLDSSASGETVRINGWVRSVRKHKRVGFAAIGDGSSIDSLQAVLKPEHAAQLSHGTAVTLEGQWLESQKQDQSHELQTQELQVQGENDAEGNPLQPKYQTAEYLRTIPHLRPRIPANALLLRLRSQVIASLTKFFNEEDFIQTHTPIITSSDCEGAGEAFTVSSNASKESDQREKPESEAQVEHFFRTPKYLTVSAQLHLEALAQAVDKVWTLSPTFRAEKSDTARHLSEFYMLEAEQCFVQDVGEVMDLVERMLRAVAADLKQSTVGKELLKARTSAMNESKEHEPNGITAETLQRRWDGMVLPNWPRVDYKYAIERLRGLGYADLSYENGLETEHERVLADLDEGKRPLFVMNYPELQKPFYMLPNQPGSKTVACFDLLIPDLCELVGGSSREHRSKELEEAMRKKGVAGNNLDWYHDLRKYGSVSHGGFGLGFDRLLCYLSGVSNIRDIVAFPRWYGRCDC